MRWPVQPRCWMGCIPHNALPSHQRLLICPFLRIRGRLGWVVFSVMRSHPTSVCLSAPSSACRGRLGWVAFSAPIPPAFAYLPLPPRAGKVGMGCIQRSHLTSICLSAPSSACGEGGMGCIQRNALPSHQRLLICPFLRVRGRLGWGTARRG